MTNSAEPVDAVAIARRAATNALIPVLRRAVLLSCAVAVAVVVIGGAIGATVAGWNGVWSAVCGAGISLAFAGITAASFWYGVRRIGIGFLAVVLGAWVVKIIVFFGVLAAVRDAPFIHRGVLFGCIVAAILGSILADMIAARSVRRPTVDLPVDDEEK